MADPVIHLLAERPDLVRPLGALRWAQWADHAGREDPAFWVRRTAQEAGRDDLPVTFVAETEPGTVAGGVGLGAEDVPGLPDRSPWILGMVVHPDHRGTGVGRALLAAAERHAADLGAGEVWVATGGDAVDFYRRCGYRLIDRLGRPGGDDTSVLVKAVTARPPGDPATADPSGRTAP